MKINKKVLFLQNNGNSVGGIWFVNKTLATELVKKGYDCRVLGIRKNAGKNLVNTDLTFQTDLINEVDLWEIPHSQDIIACIKKFDFFKAISLFFKKLIADKKLKNDFNKTKEYIKKSNPDYIICTHYQILDAIPKEFYKKTIYEHHTSFDITKSQSKTIKKLNKYNNKIGKIVWLSKNICDLAIEYGFSNSTYIYNPVKFETNKISNVTKNKKIVTITRISAEKRIDEMIEIVQNVFQSEKYNEWVFEIYGKDNPKLKINNIINNKKQIKMMGITLNPKEVLLGSSINLNTSSYEGFSMGILEALECGVPTVSFNNSEAITEIIGNNENGFIVKQNDYKEFENKLKRLLDNENLLRSFSKKAKATSENFHVEKIIENWLNLFSLIDNNS